MFERRSQPLLPRRAFAARMARGGFFAAGLAGGSLAIGTLGYHAFAGLAWTDSFLNASMILTGEGPVDPMGSTGAKVFASAYALFSGVVFLTSLSVLLAPLVHRFFHHFHLEAEDESGGESPPK